MRKQWLSGFSASVAVSLLVGAPALAQLVDRTLAPNTANEGIAKSYEQQVGAGRGTVMATDSSLFIINRDPARAIRRGRQIFQRKFTRVQGQGPLELDGAGDINNTLIIGAGLSDSCASCHGRPQAEPLAADLAAHDPEEGWEDHERLARVREGLDALRHLERQIVLMTLEGLKPATIAAQLGLSRDVVRARKSRAIRKLACSIGFQARARPPTRAQARGSTFDAAGRHEKRRRPWRIR